MQDHPHPGAALPAVYGSGPPVVVDLFAGPGGWSEGLALLGLAELGVEWDDAAVATARAAGHARLQADVSALDPADHPCDLLIASPPCQAFSMAGKGEGRRAMDAYRDALDAMGRGQAVDVAALDDACGDPRGHLVLEPLRWALATRPAWIACEQVAPVLPLWEAMAEVLRGEGYNAWTGVLSAEQYGVPQTRRRAILLASRVGPATKPPATHARYVAPRKVEEETLGLFDAPDPERVVEPEDRDLLPWVSMADALGWGQNTINRERAAGSWVVDTGNTRSGSRVEGRWRETAEPAPAVTTRADQMEWRPDRITGQARNSGPGAARDPRPLDAPSFTVRAAGSGSHPSGVEWVGDGPPDRYDSRGQRDTRSGTPVPARQRSTDEPAPTIAGESRNDSWVHDRPATTVACDPRVQPPGHKVNADDLAAGRDGYDGRAGTNAVRVSVEEAAVLQSFPVGYPWQGSKSKVFQQIGNAVPPLLAAAVIAHLLGDALPVEAAQEAAA